MRWSNVALFFLEIIWETYKYSHCNYICAAAGAGDPESYIIIYFVFQGKKRENGCLCVCFSFPRFVFLPEGFARRRTGERKKMTREKKKLGN